MRATNSFWERRWLDLTVERLKLGHILDALESKVDRAGEQNSISSGPATIAVSALEDDDFESASTASNAPATQLLLDLGSGDTGAIFKSESTPTSTFRGKYTHAHTLLAPFVADPHLDRILGAVSPRQGPRARRSTSSRASFPPFIKPVSACDVRMVLLKAALDRIRRGAADRIRQGGHGRR